MKVFSDSGEIIGRKKLQNIKYIDTKMEITNNKKYDFHFYGPYSEELTLQVEELCNLGFLHEVKEKKGGYYQYRYSPTEAGRQFLSQCELEMKDIKPYIDDVNCQSSRFLELVATILYFEGLDQDEIREKVFTIKSKQRYTDEEFDEAVAYIEKLKDLC